MTIPVEMGINKIAYIGTDTELGTWTWTKTSGTFTGTTIVVRFGKLGTAEDAGTVSVTLSSESGLAWSGGVLTDLSITPDQLKKCKDEVGLKVQFWITLEEAGGKIVPYGKGSFNIEVWGT